MFQFLFAVLFTFTLITTNTNAQQAPTAPQATPAAAPAAPGALPIVPVPAGGNAKNPFVGILAGGGGGAYEFFQYDKGKLQEVFFQQVFKQQDADYKYFLEAVNGIEGAFLGLVKEGVYAPDTGLKSLSDAYLGNVGGEPISYGKFLTSVNNFNMLKLEVETRMKTLTAIAEGSAQRQEITAEGSGLKTIPNYGRQNFQPIIEFYNSRLAAVVDFVSNLPQYVKLRDGSPHLIPGGSGKGLVLEAAAMALSPEELKAYRNQIVQAKLWGRDDRVTLNNYALFLKEKIQKFVSAYGESERYRMQSDDQLKQRAEELKLIADTFWTRSYLRAAYGMPLGYLRIDYTKWPFNIDVFAMRTKDLLNFLSQVGTAENDLIQDIQAMKNSLKRASARSAKILDGELGTIQVAENFLTFIGGNRNLAQVQVAVLNLLLQDMAEERMMFSGTLAEVYARYQNTYKSTPQNSAYYAKLRFIYDPDSITEDDVREEFKDQPDLLKSILGDEAFSQGSGAIGSGQSLKGQMAFVEVCMDTKQNDLRRADELAELIRNASDPNNKYSKAVSVRKKKL